MLPEIGRSKNVSQMFGICIPLAILGPLLVARESTNSENSMKKSAAFRPFSLVGYNP